MSQIDWSKVPEWAGFVGKAGAGGFLVWTDHKKYSYMNGDFDGREFIIGDPCTWRNDEIEVVDTRPPAEWNGTGLPPVGTVCEFREYCGTWAECTIIGEFKGRIICGCNATGSVGYIDLEELRPIRTPEQIAADEREAAIHAAMDDLGWAYASCERMIEFGYRKQPK